MSRTIIASIAYIILILSISVYLVSLNHSLHAQHLDGERAIENDQIFVNYFQTGSPLEMANIPGITENEIKHMFDVRALLVWGSFLPLILGILLLWLWEKIEHRLVVFLSPLAFFAFIIPATGYTSFDVGFEWFHRVFFPQGNYTFPVNSVLISTYPAEFFATMGSLIFAYTLGIAFAFLAVKIISDQVYAAISRFKNRD